MQFDNITQYDYIELVLNIIRQGIVQGMPRLEKHFKESLKSQILTEEFNIIGTSNPTWIGADKEHIRDKSNKREDIYFYLNDDNRTRIFFIEAKRLPKYQTKTEEEYVIGISSTGVPSGGIQRYKLDDHGTKDIRHNGMIAYVENKSITEWEEIINQSILLYYPEDSSLISSPYKNVYYSIHQYVSTDEHFTMHHFWIDLM